MDPRGTQSQTAFIQAEADRLVRVACFAHPHEAHLARLQLETEGIEAVLEGEYAGGLSWPPAAGVGVRVRAWQEARARDVLEAGEPRPDSADWITGDLDATRCPACGSLRIVEPLHGRRGRWRVLGLPLPFGGARCRCRRCGHRWAAA